MRVVVRGDIQPQPLDIQKLNESLKRDLNGQSTITQVRFIPIQIIEAPDSPNIVIKPKEASRLVKGH